MSEFRYNVLTKDWVIIATERAKRPEDFKARSAAPASDSKEKCPFCKGKEDKTPPEIFAYREVGTAPNTPGWWVRVIPNQFPALSKENDNDRKRVNDVLVSMKGNGIHDVIIESPDHNQMMAMMDQKQVEEIFFAYRQRYIELSELPEYESIILFKNHGAGAGTSLSHPHSQIVAMPITPMMMRRKIQAGEEYFDQNGKCLYCHLIEIEKEQKERIVMESDNFIVFEFFSSNVPFDTVVIPKWHSSSFENITANQCRELAGVIRLTLKKLYTALNNPDFNMVLYASPTHEKDLEYYHWHIKIFPRISNVAGFEMGSGVYINTVIPEAAAKYLREA